MLYSFSVKLRPNRESLGAVEMPHVLRNAYGHEYLIGAGIRLGSDPANQVVLADRLASPVHATVWEWQGKLYLRDENSRAGTFVNGARVREAVLHPGDLIRIGDSQLAVAAVPEARPRQTAPPPRAAKRSSGCLIWLLAGCTLVIVACVAAGVGGYFAYRTGLITPQKVLNLVGLGPADIEVDNFRDDAIHAFIQQLDASQDSTPLETTLEIDAFDIRSYTVGQPGRYRIDFSAQSDGASLGTCTLTLKSGDQYQFVALPDRIVVNRLNHPASAGADLVVTTSALCR